MKESKEFNLPSSVLFRITSMRIVDTKATIGIENTTTQACVIVSSTNAIYNSPFYLPRRKGVSNHTRIVRTLLDRGLTSN